MSTEEQKNQDLISVLSVYNVQATASALIVLPTLPYDAVVVSGDTATQSTSIATLVQFYLPTMLKVKSILNK